MTAPLRPTSVEASLGELWRRVQILEAIPQNQPILPGAMTYSAGTPTSVASQTDIFGSNTPIDMGDVVWETEAGMVDLGSFPERITCVRAGLYIVNAEVAFVSGVAGTFFRYFSVFGSATFGGGADQFGLNDPTNGWRGSSSWLAVMEVGDYVYIGAIQGSIVAVDAVGSLQIQMIGPKPTLL